MDFGNNLLLYLQSDAKSDRAENVESTQSTFISVKPGNKIPIPLISMQKQLIPVPIDRACLKCGNFKLTDLKEQAALPNPSGTPGAGHC